MLEELLKRKKEFEDALHKANAKADISAADKKKFDYMSKEKVLRDADIIICTLNYSGNSILDCLTMEKNQGVSLIDVVIIDEAAQCLEVDFLIPMRFQCNKVIQVGDPEQLPATVLSTRAQDFKFQKSFFERIYYNFFFEEKNPIRMLYIQYRMHPEICSFPSLHFYRGRLLTHKETIDERKKTELEPYLVFDLPDSKEKGEDDNGSLYNPHEAEQLIDFCKMIRTNYREFFIGIITPYQKQAQYISRIMHERNLDRVEVGTVDSFQGREKDIILFSSVRSNSSNTIGFLANKQRLNVSLTRAKHALYIFCNSKTLRGNLDWGECIKNAAKRNLIRTIQIETSKQS